MSVLDDFVLVDGDDCACRGNCDPHSPAEFEVVAWPGDYGLASMSVECNRLILYMRFAHAKFRVSHPRNPAWRDHQMPTLTHSGRRNYTFEKCVEELRFQRFSLDFGQSFRRCSEIHAFGVMVQRILGPVLEYLFWIDAGNFNRLTRLWYSRQLPPLLSVWYIQQRRQRALDIIKAQENLDESEECCMREYFGRHARECFQILSTRLGVGEFFFEDHPSSLDCVVYAYLAPLVKIPFPTDDISKALRTFSNLVAYVHRIDINYQPELVDTRPRVLPTKRADDGDDEMESSWRLKLFSSVFVACAMVGYAFANNIVTFHK